MVDASDKERLDEVQEHFFGIIADEAMSEADILVFCNKMDLPNAISTNELSDLFQLHRIKDGRKWYVQETVATKGQGLYEGLDWLCDVMRKK